jgi:hypothetical protein
MQSNKTGKTKTTDQKISGSNPFGRALFPSFLSYLPGIASYRELRLEEFSAVSASRIYFAMSS